MPHPLLDTKALSAKSTLSVLAQALSAAACAVAHATASAAAAPAHVGPAARSGATMESVLVFKNPEPAPAAMDVAPPGGVLPSSQDRLGQPLRALTPGLPEAASSAEGLPSLPVAAGGGGADLASAPTPALAGKPVAVFGTMQAAAQAGIDPLQRKAQVVSAGEPQGGSAADSGRPAWLLELGAVLRRLERMTPTQLLELIRSHPPVALGLAAGLAGLLLLGARWVWRSRKARR